MGRVTVAQWDVHVGQQMGGEIRSLCFGRGSAVCTQKARPALNVNMPIDTRLAVAVEISAWTTRPERLTTIMSDQCVGPHQGPQVTPTQQTLLFPHFPLANPKVCHST